MPYSNLEKQRAAQNASAKRRRSKINETVTKKRREIKQYVDSLKTMPCKDCETTFPSCVMEFHHRPGEEKLFALAHASNMRKSIAAIDAEAAKCVLLCANCHRLRHMQDKSRLV